MTRIAKPKRSRPNPIPHVEPAPEQLPMFPRTREQIGAESKSRWPRYPLRIGRRVRVLPDGVPGVVERRTPLDGEYTYRVRTDAGERVMVPSAQVEAS
jgi:hypothetical protein